MLEKDHDMETAKVLLVENHRGVAALEKAWQDTFNNSTGCNKSYSETYPLAMAIYNLFNSSIRSMIVHTTPKNSSDPTTGDAAAKVRPSSDGHLNDNLHRQK